MQCQATAATTGDRCKNSGSSVLNNGFCAQHQYVAIQQILYKLKQVESMLGRLESEPNVDRRRVEQALQTTQLLKQQLDGAKQLCDSNADCSIGLQRLLVQLQSIQPVDSAQPIRGLDKVQVASAQIMALAPGSSPQDAEAFRTVVNEQLARQRLQDITQSANSTQYDMAQVITKADEQERAFQAGIRTLATDLQQTQQRRAQAEQVITDLTKKLDEAQGQSKQVGGVYLETIGSLKADVDKYKELYNNMIGREIQISKSMEQLTKAQQVLENSIIEMRQSYETKISQLKTLRAESTGGGAAELSAREESLQRKVQELEAALEEAVSNLQTATEHGEEALDRTVSSYGGNCGLLAKELQEVNDMLKTKTAEATKLHTQYTNLQSTLAQVELKVAEQIDTATDADRKQIASLNEELISVQRKLNEAQKTTVTLSAQVHNLRREYQLDLQKHYGALRAAKAELEELRAKRAETDRLLNTWRKDAERTAKVAEEQAAFRVEKVRTDLNQRYMAHKADLENQYAQKRIELEDHRRSLKATKAETDSLRAALQQQQMQLDKYRQAYDKKMSEFESQRNTLQSGLAQAKEQANQFASIENDYKKRLNVQQQSMDIQRQRYEALIEQLQSKLTLIKNNRVEVVNSLEKCSAARNSIAMKMNGLQDENARLKDLFLQLKSRTETMRAQYEAHLEKLRSDAAKMQGNMALCAQRLQDASLVHDHVQRDKADAMNIRRQLEASLQQAKGNEQALRRLLQDVNTKEDQVVQLQNALRDSVSQRERMGTQLKSANEEIFQLRRISDDVTANMRQLSSDYQRAQQERDATLTKAELTNRYKEQELRNQVAKANYVSKKQEAEIGRLRTQKVLISDDLANTEVENARRIDLLVAADRAANRASTTGKSTLI